PRSPHPPRLTSFPYPTLFRSAARHLARSGPARRRALAADDREAQLHGLRAPGNVARRQHRLVGTAGQRAAADTPAEGEAVGTRRDRKSTRLNSSHLVISYAVF